MILADTHALIWLRTADARLGTGARQALDDALKTMVVTTARLLHTKQEEQCDEYDQ